MSVPYNGSACPDLTVHHLEKIPPASENTAEPATVKPRVSIHLTRCFTAQDGHSFAEDRLYNALWNCRKANEESAESKLVCLGWDRMASLAGMTWRNAKLNCLRLMKKLAIEKVRAHDSENRIGTTYRIYSYKAIIRRRREAGMEWVVRNRGGVTFAPSPGETKGTVSLEGGGLKTTVPPEGRDSKATVVTLTTGTVVTETTDTVVTETTPLSHIEVNEVTTSSSPAHPDVSLPPAAPTPRAIVDAFQELAGHSDDDAVRRIVSGCQKKAPNATEEEIIDRMRHQAVRISQINHRDGRIANPVGFLITEVPKCFEPQSLAALRESRHHALELVRKQRDDRRLAHLQTLEDQRRILQDPRASEWERHFAEQALALEDEQRGILADPRSSADQVQMARQFLCED